VSAYVRSRLVKWPVISGLICVEIAANCDVLPTRLAAKEGDGCRSNDDGTGVLQHLPGNGSSNISFSRQLSGGHH